MMFLNSSLKTTRATNTQSLIWFAVLILLEGLFCSVASPSENSPKQDDLAKIESGFFVSRNDVYGLRDQVFKEKLLIFLTQKGIFTKSSRGLIYYYISEDAIAQIEDAEFKERVREFVTEPPERKVHIVQPGDYLWKIATKYSISVEELVYLNNMTLNEPIYPGQELIVAPEGD